LKRQIFATFLAEEAVDPENFVERESRELTELSSKWKEAGITKLDQVTVTFTVGIPPDRSQRVRITNE